MKLSEKVIDLEENPFINSRNLRKTILSKFAMSDDHSMVAMTLDIGNTEKLTGFVKDMKTG